MRIYYHSVGRNGLLLLNVPPDQRGLIAAEDSARLMEFAAALQLVFAHDLAQKAIEIKASHVRGEKSPIVQNLKNRAQKSSLSANEQAYGAANLLDTNYHSYWAVDDTVRKVWVMLEFDEPESFNRVMLQEYIPLGQRVSKFHIEIMLLDGKWQTVATETTIGYKRIVLLPMCTTKAVRICIDESLACPVLNRVALFKDEVFSVSLPSQN